MNYEILLNINSTYYRINDKIEIEFISNNKRIVTVAIIKDINTSYMYIYNLKNKLYYEVVYNNIIKIKGQI